jgi:hypothetical protein
MATISATASHLRDDLPHAPVGKSAATIRGGSRCRPGSRFEQLRNDLGLLLSCAR